MRPFEGEIIRQTPEETRVDRTLLTEETTRAIIDKIKFIKWSE
jgi:hypothetical protein